MEQFNLNYIVRQCQEEAQKKGIDEIGFCFELFRRAIDEEEDLAWAAIQDQYRGLVIKWLQRVASEPLSIEVREEMIQNGFMKFWIALKKRPSPLINHFDHVGALLNYLNQCMITICLDYYRREQRRIKLEERMKQEYQLQPKSHSQLAPHEIMEQTLEEMDFDKLLQLARSWIKKEVSDPKEKLLLKLIYEEGLKPRQITKQYPEEFPTYRDLHRVRVRVLKRARRALKN